ncbi:MAG: META domain-containing protein [Roseiflexaceae bacterium]|jgi:heat shock protein HslJ
MRRLLILSMMVLVSWGCALSSAEVTPQATVTSAVDTLSGEWLLQQMNGETLAELTVSLEFQANQIAGVGFCNNYSATITVDESSFVVDPAISATRMMCPEGDTMQQEQVYFETLTKVASFAEVDGRLELRDETGAVVLVYQR